MSGDNADLWHPYAPPATPDPHTVPVVFRFINPGFIAIGIGAVPRETKIGTSRQWFAKKENCRELWISDPGLPKSLREVVNFAVQEPKYLTFRWVAMLTKEEVAYVLKKGDPLTRYP